MKRGSKQSGEREREKRDKQMKRKRCKWLQKERIRWKTGMREHRRMKEVISTLINMYVMSRKTTTRHRKGKCRNYRERNRYGGPFLEVSISLQRVKQNMMISIAQIVIKFIIALLELRTVTGKNVNYIKSENI